MKNTIKERLLIFVIAHLFFILMFLVPIELQSIPAALYGTSMGLILGDERKQ